MLAFDIVNLAFNCKVGYTRKLYFACEKSNWAINVLMIWIIVAAIWMEPKYQKTQTNRLFALQQLRRPDNLTD